MVLACCIHSKMSILITKVSITSSNRDKSLIIIMSAASLQGSHSNRLHPIIGLARRTAAIFQVLQETAEECNTEILKFAQEVVNS